MAKIKFIKKDNLNEESIFTYYIELINREGDDIAIRGWVYSSGNSYVEVALTDNDKNVLPESKVWRKTRRDVKKLFELNDDNKAEFLIRFNRDSVKSNNVNIHLYNEEGDMNVPIDMAGLDMSFTTSGKILGFLSDHPVKRTFKYIARGGLFEKISSKLSKHEDAYTVWRETNTPSDADYNEQRKHRFDYNPLISISIPLYNTPIDFFEALMKSVMNQTYTNFELCLADGSDNDKLKADNIRIICERNGLKNPVYVGDTQMDADACRQAGIPIVYASYGFGTVKEPDYVIKTPMELTHILK